jgi:hypothetical protein
MANSKFSGVGFASGQNSNSNSVIVGYESGQNRRWTLAELAAGLPGSSLQQVMNAGSVSTVTSQATTIRVDSNTGNYSQFTMSGGTPGDRATMQSQVSNGDGSFIGTSIFGSSMSWSTFGVGNRTIEIGPSTFQIRDDVANKGIVYHSDYSANFTARSLVDKDYVDGLVGATPTLQDVVDQSNIISNNNATGLIRFKDGNVLSELDLGFVSGSNRFDIRTINGLNDIFIQPSTFTRLVLAGGSAGTGVPDARSLIIQTSNTPPTGLDGTITMGSAMLTEVEGPIKIFNDLQDSNGSTGTSGQVLVSQGGSGSGTEWTSISAFSPIDVASSELNTVGATTQYYYQTIAGATMTISKAKVWGYSGTDTVLFGVYRGKFGSLTLIGQGSAVCSIGPNEINLIAEVGQNLQVTAGEDIVVGLYPSGISWTTVYSQGIGDANFAIENTANISTMPATPTGAGTETRFACTLY